MKKEHIDHIQRICRELALKSKPLPSSQKFETLWHEHHHADHDAEMRDVIDAMEAYERDLAQTKGST